MIQIQHNHFLAQVRKSVDSPPGMLTEDHHHTVHEERQSATPLTCARNPFIFELRDSAEALVERLLK